MQTPPAATISSAYPPCASRPVARNCEHRFSSPRTQNSQVPQAEKIQATPTRSPGRNMWHDGPRAFTRPTTWCPRMIGRWRGGVLPSISSSSVWQTPQVCTLIKSSPSTGTGSARSAFRSGVARSRREPVASRSMGACRCFLASLSIDCPTDRGTTTRIVAQTRRRTRILVAALRTRP